MDENGSIGLERLRARIFAPPDDAPWEIKGIAPALLLEQVRNTAPFLFEAGFTPDPSREPFLVTLQRQAMQPGPLDALGYYELCLSAHHASVATFVPTDVDVHIRLKLWRSAPGFDAVREMARLVDASLEWDFSRVTARVAIARESGERVAGHHGEWFSTIAAAYASVRRRDPDFGRYLEDRILGELQRQSDLYEEIEREQRGIARLVACAAIAHNLGDLDRVLDLWEIPTDSPLRARTTTHLRVGEIYKAMMAAENHRHYPLRKARALRRRAEYLLPTPPFLDEWGSRIATHPDLAPEEVGDVAEALVDGFEKVPGAVGYARALAGIEQSFRGGLNEICRHLPRKIAQRWKTGPLRQLCSVPRQRFEASWERAALKFKAGGLPGSVSTPRK